MKVIKPGREQKGWSKQFKCTGNGNGDGGCGAILLVEEGDLYRTERSFMAETDHYITFKCCACGVETDLSKKDEPSLNRDIPSKEQWLKKRKKAKARRAQLVTPPVE